MGVGALGMYFMYELCKKMLTQVVDAIKDINLTMQKFVLEQHQEHKKIIESLNDLTRPK